METAQKLIGAMATLLWPLIVIAVLLRFRPAIAAIVESAKSRKFTLKIGGQELTMEEANQQQQNLIADLQTQVAEIKKKLDLTPAAATLEEHTVAPAPPAARVAPPVHRVLWVDDNPKNNSYFIEQLGKVGVTVDLAASTHEALKLLDTRKYDYILSDMGRSEGLVYSSRAGMDLLAAVRERFPALPFIFFCSPEAVEKYGEEALGLGATAITSSGVELAGLLASLSGGN